MWLLAWYVRSKHFVYGLFGLGEPHVNTIWFDGLGQRNAGIRANAKCFRAMDIIYDYHLVGTNIFDKFWIGMRNAQAVRNRRLEVKSQLSMLIGDRAECASKSPIKILSLACGSARDVIESILEAKQSAGIAVNALLVDINPEALKAAQKYAEECGVADEITTLQADIVTVWPEAKKFSPHIVHIIGLLEYVPHDKAINLLAAVHGVLAGGVLITSNTVNNLEAGFLRRVIGWNMIYRPAWQLKAILQTAGFEKVEIIGEPHGIQNIAIAK